jgi:hypothetical protein
MGWEGIFRHTSPKLHYMRKLMPEPFSIAVQNEIIQQQRKLSKK